MVTWDEDDFYSRGEEDAYNSRDEVTSIIFATVTPSFETDQLHLKKSLNTFDRTTYIYIIRQAGDEGLQKRKGFSEKDFKWHIVHFLWGDFSCGAIRLYWLHTLINNSKLGNFQIAILQLFPLKIFVFFVQVADFLLNDLTESETQKELSKWFAQVMFKN